MPESLHRTEVRYIRAQTIIAALNLAATAALSATGFWIAHVVNSSSSAQHDKERDEDNRRELGYRCLDLRMRELSLLKENITEDEKYDLSEIEDSLAKQCEPIGLRFGVTTADGTMPTVQQMERDVQAFLDWTAEPKVDRK